MAAPAPDDSPASDRELIARAAWTIAVVAAGAVAWQLKNVLAPFAIAIFLAVIIDALGRRLRAIAPPRLAPAALPFAVAAVMAGLMLLAIVAAENARSFAAELVADEPKLDGLIAHLSAEFGVSVPPTLGQLAGRVDLVMLLERVSAALRRFGGEAVWICLYVAFLFLSRAGLKRRVGQLFRSAARRAEADAVVERIRAGLERYLWVQTLTGGIVAGASWGLMRAVGLDHAEFWAVVVFVASYVPIIGGAVGILLPPLFALVQFDTHWQALVLALGAEAIHMVVGNVVAPRLQGSSLNLDPVIVVLALTFWGLLWGAPGMFLSTPITVSAMIVLAQFPSVRWIAILMSRDGAPGAH